MAYSLEAFAKNYYGALKDIASVLPARTTVPNYIKNTSFVIASSDRSGRLAIDIVSRDNINELMWNGKNLKPIVGEDPGFIIARDLPSIAKVLFPQDDIRTSVSITIGNPHVILSRLAFSNQEYNNKYWSDAKFYRNCAGSIPFMVNSTGSMLGLDLLWGAELGGQRQERLFEFIKLYGRETLPAETQQLRDDAFRDIGHAIPKLGRELDEWSFTDFLSNLQTPVDTNVLLLGSYHSEDEFDKLKETLQLLGYNGFLLKDSPDLPIQSNLEKLFSAIICSCFIIVLDKQASGHIAELSHMLQHRFRPVIILRDTEKPSTAFLEDRLLTDDYFRIAVIKDIDPQSLLPHIKWARNIVDNQIKNFNAINKWRG